MKDFAERTTPAHARRPAAQAESPQRAPAGSSSHARGVAQRERIEGSFGSTAQRAGEEEELQMKSTAQRAAEEEEPLQGRFDPVQRLQDEEEPLQARAEPAGPAAAPAAEGGLPAGLRQGIEAMSGMDLSDVQVHNGSSRPAEINALAYTQGNQIHVAPGQEQHLPHEAWHVVQQRQGRVQPTMQIGEVHVNDDAALEAEADRMGARAASTKLP